MPSSATLQLFQHRAALGLDPRADFDIHLRSESGESGSRLQPEDGAGVIGHVLDERAKWEPRLMTLNRSIRWRGLHLDTLENCHVIANGRDTRIRGAIIGPDFGLFYRLKLDENGHTRTVKIERTDGKTLELFADGAGGWSDDRAEPIAALNGCVDVDIWPTPLTNSLPIWRQDWTDQPVRFAMAWIDATDLSFKRSEQVYTRLDPTHFRYQSANFEAVLEIDADGIVTDYPGLFSRI